MERNEDVRGKRIVFCSSCLLNVNHKVRGLARYEGMYEALMHALMEYGVGIQQMDCPETLYLGIQRWSATKNLYDCSGFRRFCRKLAMKQADYLESYLQMGYDVFGVLCINGSPTCGYTVTCYDEAWGGEPKSFGETSTFCDGTGVYIEELESEIKERGIPIPEFIGLDIEDFDVDIEQVAEDLSKRLEERYGPVSG